MSKNSADGDLLIWEDRTPKGSKNISNFFSTGTAFLLKRAEETYRK